ncbi:hypothetical protein Tco_0174149 [Tanacetum coccineum]
MERAATTTFSLKAEQDNGNINRTQSMETLNESFPQGTDSRRGSQESNDPSLSRVNTLGSRKDSMKLKELMELCTKLSGIYLLSIHGLYINMDPHEFSHVCLVVSSVLVMNRGMLVYNTASLSTVRQLLVLTATVNTLDNGEQEITATIDGHVKTVTIASVRKYLQLADAVPQLQMRLHSQVCMLFMEGLSLLSRLVAGTGVVGIDKYHELTVICTKLYNKVERLETELKQQNQTYGVFLLNLSNIGGERREELSIEEMDIGCWEFHWFIHMLSLGEVKMEQNFADTQEGRFLLLLREVTTVMQTINTWLVHLLVLSVLKEMQTTIADDLTLAETLMEIRKSAAKAKGKAKMDETESLRKMKQREQGFTDAEWDDVLARVAADEDFVQQL